MKRLIVRTLELLCRLSRHTHSCGFGGLSLDLDNRWGIGYWARLGVKPRAEYLTGVSRSLTYDGDQA